MDLKYYDLLSCTIVGITLVVVVNYLFFDNISLDGVAYIAIGYVFGYFINAIGSLLESFYYITIGGMPSDKLLTEVDGQSWTGYKRVKFYEAHKAISAIKDELNNPNASVKQMFGCAMRKVNGCEDCRVPTFNAQYAWSRSVLTTVLLIDALFAIRFYAIWWFWFVALGLLLIAWNRYKERGYYYAREVLNEYLNHTN